MNAMQTSTEPSPTINTTQDRIGIATSFGARANWASRDPTLGAAEQIFGCGADRSGPSELRSRWAACQTITRNSNSVARICNTPSGKIMGIFLSVDLNSLV